MKRNEMLLAGALACAVLTSAVAAQEPVATLPIGAADSCKSVGLDPELYAVLLNRQFVALVGSAQTVPGSFGSLEVDKEQKVRFAASAQPGNGRVLSIEASGGLSDGVLAFINNQASRSTFTATARLHLISPVASVANRDPSVAGRKRAALGDSSQLTRRSGHRLEYLYTSCLAYRAAAAKAQDTLVARLTEIAANAAALRQRYTVARDSIELARIVARMDSVSRSGYVGAAEGAEKPLPQLDSLRLDSIKIAAALAVARQVQVPEVADQEYLLLQQHGERLRAAQEQLKVTGFSLGWVSLSGGVANTAFKLFNALALPDSQITDRTYASPRLGISYSRYTHSIVANATRFWSIGVQGSIEDNASALRKVELTDTEQHGDLPGERVAKKTVTALEGDYERDLRAFAATADWYQFLFRGNQAAIHLFPGVTWRDEFAPRYAAGIGVLWAARSEKPPLVTGEVFYALTDITESERSDDNVWERGTLGLRVTFPVNLIR